MSVVQGFQPLEIGGDNLYAADLDLFFSLAELLSLHKQRSRQSESDSSLVSYSLTFWGLIAVIDLRGSTCFVTLDVCERSLNLYFWLGLLWPP